MLKPIRWNTFIRDFLVIQIGFLLYGFAIALIVRADLGTGTWLVLEVALANILGIKIGTMTVYMGFIILILAFGKSYIPSLGGLRFSGELVAVILAVMLPAFIMISGLMAAACW